jgi:hypothetical protein
MCLGGPDSTDQTQIAPCTAAGGMLVDLGANNDVTVAGVATAAGQLPDGHNVTVDNGAGGAAVNIQDGGNSITVDNAALSVVGGGLEATALRVTIASDSTGVVTVDGTMTADAGAGTFTVDGSGVTQPISAVALPLPAGAATAALQLPDGHNVTCDNGPGAAAVNIQDGGNIITVDGTVTADAGAGTFTVDGSGVTQPISAVSLPLPTGAATAAAQLPDGHNVTVDNATIAMVGNVADDAADSGNPVKIGFKAREFNSDPDTMTANNDRVDAIATAQGIQFVLGGHPNPITREYMTTAAQTNDEIIATVAAGSQIVITQIDATVDNSTSVDVQVRIGFGATGTVPTEPTSGNTVDGMVLSHPGIAGGSGISKGNGGGILAVGGDGLELGITNSVPTGGKLTVVVTYYIATL